MTDNLGWRHVQALLLCFGMSIAYSLRVCMSVAVIAMRNPSVYPNIPEYNWENSTYNIILGSFFWSYVAMQIPAGYFVKFGSTVNILALGIFASSVLNMLIPWLATYGYEAVIFGRVGMGFCESCIVICVSELMSRWIPPMERARLGSLVMSGISVGTVAGMLISGWLVKSRFGWPSIFYCFGISGMFWSISFYFLSADDPSDHAFIGSHEVQFIKSTLNIHNDTAESKKLKVPWKAILTSVPLWAVILAECGNLWGSVLFFNQLPAYMKYVLHYDVPESGIMSAFPYIASLIANFTVSFLADYLLKKGVSTEIVRKSCATIALWIPCLCLLILGRNFTANKTIIVGIIILSISSGSAANCSLSINVIDLCPNFVAPVTSFENAIVSLMTIVSPLLFSFVTTNATDLSQWRVILYITSGIYFISNIVYLTFGKADVQNWNNTEKETNFSNPELIMRN